MSNDSSNVPKPIIEPWRAAAFAAQEARKQELGYDPVTLERVRDLTPAEEEARNQAAIVQQRAQNSLQRSYGFRSIAELPEAKLADPNTPPLTEAEREARHGEAILAMYEGYGEFGRGGPPIV